MGKKTILAYLNKMRLEGNNDYFTMNEIAKAVGESPQNVWTDLEYLNNHNIVERQVRWLSRFKGYRLKEEHIIPEYKVQHGRQR